MYKAPQEEKKRKEKKRGENMDLRQQMETRGLEKQKDPCLLSRLRSNLIVRFPYFYLCVCNLYKCDF